MRRLLLFLIPLILLMPVARMESAGVDAFLYYPDTEFNHMLETTRTITDSPQGIIDALTDLGSIPQGVTVRSFDLSSGTLDLSKEFGDALKSTGTSGEYFFMGCTVNSFLKHYSLEDLTVLCEGEIIETGHSVYDEPLGFYGGVLPEGLENPPEIRVIANGEELPYVIQLIEWGNSSYSFEDTFQSIMRENPVLSVIDIGTEIHIHFSERSLAPDTIQLYDFLLNEEGFEKYNRGEGDDATLSFDIINETGEYVIAFTIKEHFMRGLSSLMDDYLPGASVRGFRLTCVWDGGHSCDYVFIVRV